MNRHVEWLVVGGGLGGLIAAARLQRAGHQVVVLESSADPGGRARSPMLGGLPVNLGPHALYENGHARRVLERELGLTFTGFNPQGGQFFAEGGALLPMPATPGSLFRATWLTWRERAELLSALGALTLSARRDGSMGQWVSSLRSARVQAAVAAVIRVATYTASLDALAWNVGAPQVSLALRGKGVRYLDGGWQTLVHALTSRLEVHHATVQQVAPGRVTLADGAVWSAQRVVLAVPPPVLAKWVPPLAPQVSALQPVRAACLDVVLSRLPAPHVRLALGLDAPTYASVHSPPEAAGPVVVHAAQYLTAQAPLATEAALESVLDVAQPGWRDLVVGRRYLPHMRVMDELPGAAALVAPGFDVVSGVGHGFLLDAVVRSTDALLSTQRQVA